MAIKIGLEQYPVNSETGSLYGYLDNWSGRQGVTWIDNDPFEETFTVTAFGRGRSSIKFHLVTEDGRKFEMFAKDFTEMVKTASINSGVVSGMWRIIKRGQNYGLVKVG